MLCATLDEAKLVSHLQEAIDMRSYKITHEGSRCLFDIGYFTAMADVLYSIEQGKFEVERD